MIINLLSEKELNRFITKVIYGKTKILIQPNVRGEFDNIDYVLKNKNSIILGIINQWAKLRIRHYTALLDQEPGFTLVDKNRTDLPDWCYDMFNQGKDIYDFNPRKVSKKLYSEIITARDYLYNVAEEYIDLVIKNALVTNTKVRIDYSYLKDNAKYDSFEKVIAFTKKEDEKSKMKFSTFKLKQRIIAIKNRIMSQRQSTNS